MKKRQVNIKDIAQALGVSSSTVSRALSPNKNATISKKVSERIHQKAKEMGYVSDINATALRKGETKTIGILIPDILNPIFSSVIKGAQDYLSKKGYVTFSLSSDNNPLLAEEAVNTLIARRVDGILLVSAFLEDKSVKVCIDSGIPLVLVNRSVENPHNISQVLNDDIEGMRQAIIHLYELGHRTIMHLAGPETISQGKLRREAFLTFCQSLLIEPEIIKLKHFSFEEGMKAANTLLKKSYKAKGIIAANDMIALGTMHQLQNAGFNVPKDYSVVGFNNMPLSEMVHPPLTTVAVPYNTLGKEAAHLLLRHIQAPDTKACSLTLTPILKVRQSTTSMK